MEEILMKGRGMGRGRCLSYPYFSIPRCKPSAKPRTGLLMLASTRYRVPKRVLGHFFRTLVKARLFRLR